MSPPQRSFYHRLTGDNKSEKFFKVFYERMKLAQQEIKATVTVNTSDLGSKKKDEEPPDKDTPARKKGQRTSVGVTNITMQRRKCLTALSNNSHMTPSNWKSKPLLHSSYEAVNPFLHY